MRNSLKSTLSLMGLLLISNLSIAQDNGLLFDGGDDYISFIAGPSFSGVGTMTFEAWVYPTSTTGFNTIASWTDGVNNSAYFAIANGFLTVNEDDGVQFGGVTGSIVINPNEWTHVAFIMTTGAIDFYVNGVVEVEGLPVASAGLSTIFELGIFSSAFNPFVGIIDEVRVWDVALDQTTIQNQMFTAMVGNETNLIAYYQFNETTGTVLPDLTSNAFNGTLVNFPNPTTPNWQASLALTETFIVTTNTNDFFGSFRQIINSANTSLADNVKIEFNMSPTTTISLASNLPAITRSMVIDASTQSGFVFNTNSIVTIDGGGTLTRGLDLDAVVEIYGLRVANFDGTGIFIQNSFCNVGASGKGNVIVNNVDGIYLNANSTGDVTMAYNHIGIEGDGATLNGNSADGINFSGDQDDNSVLNNLISGNANGIRTNGASGNIIMFNMIGTDITGTLTRPNNASGIRIGTGGPHTISDNLISGNTGNAVSFVGSSDHLIQNNKIGVQTNGTSALGNGGHGFALNSGSPSGMTFGGVGTENIIAYNTGNAFDISGVGAIGNIILENSIFCNGGGIIISVSAQGNIQPPVIDEVTSTTVGGTGIIGEDIRVYRDNSGCTPTAGQGQEYLGTTIVDGSGNWQLIGLTITAGTDLITATTSNGTEGTSEFAGQDPFIVTNTNDSGIGSLRWCIDNANANTGTDNISFNIPNTDGNYVNSAGDERWTISPVTDLPDITEAAIVDATSQPGNGDYRIKIDGQGSLDDGFYARAKIEVYGMYFTGFTLTSGSTAIHLFGGSDNSIIGGVGKGNVINGNSKGITLYLADNLIVKSNMIGMDETGATAIPNTAGIYTASGSGSNIIGGSLAGEGNLISGNSSYGIEIRSASQTIEGNYIGTDITGLLAIPNGAGIYASSTSHQILDNTISGNSGAGIDIFSNNIIQGNNIGVGADESTPLANDIGVLGNIHLAFSNTIGGTGVGEGNIIANNTNQGIWLKYNGADFNQIIGNSIYCNGGLGIDLNLYTTTTAIGNDGKPAPVITTVTTGLVSGTGIDGDVIHLYRDNIGCTIPIQGSEYLGTTTVAGGVWTVTQGTILATDQMNATATDVSGNTSQFAINYPSDWLTVVNTDDSGVGSLRNAIDRANAIPSTNTIDFNIPITDPNYNLDGGTGDETWIIELATALPPISIKGTSIDGTTQGGNGDFRIILDGVDQSFHGITITNSVTDVSVFGLEIKNFNRGITANLWADRGIIGSPNKGNVINGCSTGINLGDSEFWTIQSNLIGTDKTGTSAVPNSIGIAQSSSDNNTQIGGTGLGEGNVISGNTDHGIFTNFISGLVVEGNLIGTDITGTTAIPNGNGLFITTSGAYNIVSNTISGNNNYGILLLNSSGGTFYDNKIGTDISGTNPVPNGRGFGTTTVNNADNNIIGGVNVGEPNIIAFNINQGILFTNINHDGNQFIGNSIFCNGGKGIDLNGVANTNKAPPIITGFTTTDVSGTGVNGDIIDIYRDNSGCTPLQGTEYLGTTTVSSGLWTLNGLTLSLTDHINATATDASNNTSPFALDFGEIAVFQGSDNTGTEVTDGQAGNVDVGVDQDQVFTIENLNDVPLNIASIAVSGSDYSIVSAPTSLVRNSTANFTLQLSGASIGTFTTTVTITSDDEDEAVFTFPVTGEISEPLIVTNTNDAGGGSLRWVIENANAIVGTDNISFNIPTSDGNYLNTSGDERWTISPVTDLPDIIEAAIVDATTQPGGGDYRIKIEGQGVLDDGLLASAIVEIYGFYISGFSSVTASSGIHLVSGAGNSIIGGVNKGNLINNNSRGIWMFFADNVTVHSNLLGLNELGVVAVPNSTGIYISNNSVNNIIGGSTADEGNFISGNTSYGLYILGGGQTVEGNLIGTDITGLLAIANGSGVFINGSNNNSFVDNVIAGNTGRGILVGTNGNTFYGNKIGVGVDGTTPLGNNIGIEGNLSFVSNNIIGGINPDEGNIIAHNTNEGVLFDHASYDFNQIIGNSIYCNGGRGIELNLASTSAFGNDAKVAPVITAVSAGTVSGTGIDNDVIHLYRDESGCLPIQGGEYLGTTTVSGGVWTINEGTILAADQMNATATDVSGNTSQFANNYPSDWFTVVNTNDSGVGSLREAINRTNLIAGSQTIDFNIPNSDGNYTSGVREIWTISPTTDLPTIIEAAILDATTQTGTGNFNIVLDGSLTTGRGLNFTKAGSEVYGFYIIDFSTGIRVTYNGAGITIGDVGKGNTIVNCTNGIGGTTSSDHVIQGNYIGTDENGTMGIGNTGKGLDFGNWNFDLVIGGSNAGEGNVISGNGGSGIYVNNSSNSQIEGNYFGTDPTGLIAIPNGTGIYLGSQGGTKVFNNIISGNAGNGISFNNSSTSIVQGNYIGVGSDGTTAIPNNVGISGFTSSSASNHIIGGVNAGEGNIISNNINQGILFTNANHINNQIIGNAIFCNGGIGIDLNGAANGGISPPSITGFTTTQVYGTGIDTDVIHVYRDNSGCTPTQGQEYLGTATVSGGIWTVTGLTLNSSDKFNATATDAAGNTSEFIDLGAFITTWSTTDGQIAIPTTGAGYNYDIVWTNLTNALAGDGSINGQTGDYTITGLNDTDIYQVEITGAFPAIDFGSSSSFNPPKILTIEQWGDIEWTSMRKAFEGCSNLRIPAIDAPDLSLVSNMEQMFWDASSFNDPIDHWDVSTITNMNSLFSIATSFDQPLSSWDVSNVTNMSGMFDRASTFNQDINNWDVGAVSDMSWMFASASVFNQNLNSWILSNLNATHGMFLSATNFNGDLNSWNVSAVTDMHIMFGSAINFNQDIGNWDVSSVTEMNGMFDGASTFNQDISGWIVSSVLDMNDLFFDAHSFNQDISSWDVSAVTTMIGMFGNATLFNQNLGSWDVGAVTDMEEMLDNTALSTANYDATLIGWEALSTLQSGVLFGAVGLTYCASITERSNIISTYGWAVDDAGEDCSTTGGIIECDYNALIALYNATDGANWINNSNWLSGNSASSWYGISVVGNRVVGINLDSNNLNGSLPNNINCLTTVTNMDLGSNQISGPIPPEIGNMIGLTNLRMDINQLSGSIPTELWNLINLQYINLESNFLSGILSADVGNLTQLLFLELNFNQLSGTIPDVIGTVLTNLQLLNISENQFSGTIPTSLGNLTNLIDLDLDHNILTGSIPNELSNLVLMEQLELDANQLTGTIPSFFGTNYPNLIHLDLAQNMLNGAIPKELGSLQNVIELELWSNQLSGLIPLELGNMTALQELELNDNQLTGAIPVEIGNLSNLNYIDLSTNQLTGTVPVELVSLNLLTSVALNNNQLIDLQDFSSNSLILNFKLENNRLEFDDIEPNTGVSGITYAPQNKLNAPPAQNLTEEEPLNLSINVGGSGNQYQWVKDGVDISGETTNNLVIGSVALSDAGTYHLIITSSLVSGLTLQSEDVVVNITPTSGCAINPSSFAGVDQSVCEGEIITLTGSFGGAATALTWSTGGNGSFNDINLVLAQYTPGTGDITAGSVSLIVTTDDPDGAGPCLAATDVIIITITPQPTIAVNPDFTICEGDATSLTAIIGGSASTINWSSSGDGSFDDNTSATPVYNAGTTDISAGSATLTATTDDPGAGICIAATDDVIITIEKSPTVDAGLDQSVCATDLVNLTGMLGGAAVSGTWTTNGDGSFDNSNNVSAVYTLGSTDLSNGNVVLTLTSLVTASCIPTSDNLSVSINQPISVVDQTISINIGETSNINVINGATLNIGDILTTTVLAAPSKGTAIINTDGSINYSPNGGTVGSDSFDFTVCNQCNLCSTAQGLITIINEPPEVNIPPETGKASGVVTVEVLSGITDINGNIDLSSLTVIVQPSSGAAASFDIDGNLIIDYNGIQFTGTDQLTIGVCDFDGACTESIITIEIEALAVVAFNAVSPNGDGRHDFLEFQSIETYPNNEVKIFNRWGDVVFAISGYNNDDKIFEGKNNKKGNNKLPSGTYYYVVLIQVPNGEPQTLNGFFELRR